MVGLLQPFFLNWYISMILTILFFTIWGYYISKGGLIMTENKKKVDWISLIIGIFFIFIAFIAFKNPLASLESLVIYFGISAIFKGIGGLMIHHNIKKYTGLNINIFMWTSILDILLGILIVSNINSMVMTLPYAFAIWFIIDSINDLIYGSYLKDIHGGLYGLNIAINIISLILGIMMTYNPLGATCPIVYLIGMYFIISGVKYIVHAFEYQY